jgi:Electron transfer DM13
MLHKNTLVSTALLTVLFAAPVITSSPVEADVINPNTDLIAISNKGELLKSGNFQTMDKKTSGDVRLIRERNGRLFIDFGRKFRTQEGADLFVILSVSEDLKNSPVANEVYFTVSPLLRIQGEQRYILPGNFNLDTYQSVAIWDRQNNVMYGAATLK